MTAALSLAQVAIRIPLSEAARLAGVSPVTLKRRIKDKKFPAPVDRGRQLLFDRDQIVNFLKPSGDNRVINGPNW